MGYRNDLTGQRFGRLTVIRFAGNSASRHAEWECVCDCGAVKITSSNSLMRGVTQSCGCLHNEMLAQNNTKHGKSYTRLHVVWRGMKQRCSNPSSNSYKNYGGRGITVCEEWQEFKPFYEWAMANGFDESAKRGDCTIDRIDVNGNYEPSNCRWVTQKVQCSNKRNTRKETI